MKSSVSKNESEGVFYLFLLSLSFETTPIMEFYYLWLYVPPRSRQQGHLLALAVLQVKMWVEVDEDALVRPWSGDHPGAPLGGGVRHGVPGGREVAGRGDPDVSSTFICKRRCKTKQEDLI